MKYVIFDNNSNLTPIVFPKWLDHGNVAFNMPFLGAPISAGFVEISDGEIVCSGRSLTLNLGSRPDADSKIIERLILSK